MSMLTPPGMRGRNNRVTGNRYPRMRRRPRRLRTLLGLLAAVTVLGVMGYGTVQLVAVFTAEGDTADQARRESGGAGADTDGGSSKAAAGAAECETTAALPRQRTSLPEPEAITVNVYNATTRTGLAQQTADALAERGFTIGEVDNAAEELDGTVEEPGLLMGTEAAEESGALTVVGAQFDGAETGELTAGRQAAHEVDLVLGKGFAGLFTEREAERRLAAATEQARSSC